MLKARDMIDKTRLPLSLAAALLFFLPSLPASVDSLQALRYRDVSLFFLQQNCPDSSARYRDLAFGMFREYDQLADWIETIRLSGQTLYLSGNAASAEEVLLQAMEDKLWRPLRDSAEWDALGKLYAQLGAVQTALPTRDGQTLLNYETAQSILSQIGRQDVWTGLNVLLPLAHIYARRGDDAGALALLETVRSTAMTAKDPRAAALAQTSAANILMQRNRTTEAIETLRKALQLPVKDAETLAGVHQALQRAYRLRDNTGSALIHGRLAAQFYRRCGEPCAYPLALVLAENGAIQTEIGNLRDARKLLEEARAIARRTFPGENPGQLDRIYLYFGKLYHAWNEHEEALRWYQRALMSAIPAFSDKDYRIQPPANRLTGSRVIADALAGKAEAFRSMYQKSKRLEQLELSLQCHELSIHTEVLLRRAYPKDMTRALYREESRKRLQRAVETALEMAQISGNSRHRERAFAIAEQQKKMMLVEALAHNGVPVPAKMPLLQPDSAAVGVAALQNALPGKDRVYVEYLIGANKIFAFIVSKSRYQVLTMPLDYPLEAWVLELRKQIEQFSQEGADHAGLCAGYTRMAQQLYQRLVLPVEQAGVLEQRLTIIPDGVLHLLPFEALLSAQPTKACDYRNYPYLLRRYRISYGLSAGLQVELSRQSRMVHSGYLGISPVLDGRDGVPRLKHNLAASDQVKPAWGSKFLLRDQATVGNFKQKAGRFGVLHLSTWAQANPAAGPASFVLLADGKGGYDSLYISDLYSLRLKADLAWLDACNYGSLDGEAAAPLYLGFLYAGAGAVFAPLWNNDHAVSSQLRLDFMDHIRAGKSKRDALWEAKLRQINQGDALTAHPAFWAAFTAWGDMGIRESTGEWYALLWVAVAAIAISGLWLWYDRSRKQEQNQTV